MHDDMMSRCHQVRALGGYATESNAPRTGAASPVILVTLRDPSCDPPPAAPAMSLHMRAPVLRGLVRAAATLAVAVPAAMISAQPGPPRADSVLATLVTPNGEMRLTLTGRSLYVGFTALGQRRIRRAADSAFAATYPAAGAESGRTSPGRMGDVPAHGGGAKGDDEGPEKPDKPVPLREVEQVRASGDSLLVCFAPRPGPGPAAPPCGMWRRFLVTGLPPADAQRFAGAVRRARAQNLGPRG